MSRLIYIDTCIFLNAAGREEDEKGRLLWPMADALFSRAIQGEFKVVRSDWLMIELSWHDSDELQMILTLLDKNNCFVDVKTDSAIKTEVMAHSGNNADDYHHVLLAVKAGAEILVTKNYEHFKEWEHLISIKYPDQL